MKKILFGLLLVGSSINVFAGGKGNGGDICENRIIEIRNDVKQWINKGAGEKLNFPDGLTPEVYSFKMLDATESTTISCVSDKLFIGNAEKTCVNSYNDSTGESLMECNIDRFIKSTNESNQYKLIHHEYAGVAGLEVNNGTDESDYILSNQISGYLEEKLIKQLVVKDLYNNKTVNNCTIYIKPILESPLLKLKKGRYALDHRDIEIIEEKNEKIQERNDDIEWSRRKLEDELEDKGYVLVERSSDARFLVPYHKASRTIYRSDEMDDHNAIVGEGNIKIEDKKSGIILYLSEEDEPSLRIYENFFLIPGSRYSAYKKMLNTIPVCNFIGE